ncbi:MAG: ABC transporter substrate-binding protein [Alphaproteobacteria bacterium]|nr:ABC transporter substrate-binding protein [Alphaproteobacteria bacterium]
MAFGLLAHAPAMAQTKLKVAYIPIMPMSQLFVMEGEGWTKEAGLELELTKFSSGPAIVQAIASGDFDVMYFGIGPAMVSRANGVPLKVVASNVIEQIALITRGEFAETMAAAASPAEGVRTFTEEEGRKPRIASLPKGSVPDTVFRHWLIRVAGLTEDDIEIVGMGAGKVQQAMLAKSVDAASILEPIVTIIGDRLPDAKIVAKGGEMLENQPGAVVAVREGVIAEHGDAVAKLVELHVRATNLINEDPARAARHIHAFLGAGLIPVETIERALQSQISNFVADPSQIQPATKVMHDFSAEIGTLKKPVPLDELFDTSFYEKAVK